MNLKMSDLKRCLESAGFAEVKAALSSGNVAFHTTQSTEAALATKIQRILRKELGHSFPLTVRSAEYLSKLLASDPFGKHPLRPGAKRVVTFLWSRPKSNPDFPMEPDCATIREGRGTEAFSSHISAPRGPVFMKLIQSTFGIEQTTRTWETVK